MSGTHAKAIYPGNRPEPGGGVTDATPPRPGRGLGNGSGRWPVRLRRSGRQTTTAEDGAVTGNRKLAWLTVLVTVAMWL